jgi:hypothetical protein
VSKKGYQEDGKSLDNLITGGVFTSFPNVYEDNKHVGACTELSSLQLVNKIVEYEGFMQREDIMPRARQSGQRILNHLGFERSQREDTRKQEDENCVGDS